MSSGVTRRWCVGCADKASRIRGCAYSGSGALQEGQCARQCSPQVEPKSLKFLTDMEIMMLWSSIWSQISTESVPAVSQSRCTQVCPCATPWGSLTQMQRPAADG